MGSSRLRHINFQFPSTTAGSRSFFANMELFFSQVPGAVCQAGKILLTPTHPPAALPIISLQSVDVEYPQIVFETEELIDLRVGLLHLRSSTRPAQRAATPAAEGSRVDGKLLPAVELCRRLEGRVPRVDHVGVNIPTKEVGHEDWNRLLEKLSRISALCRYPENESFLFVLPTSQDEFQDDIQDFVFGREPKFELVYDKEAMMPLVQFAVATDLSRAESEELFPEPSGMALEIVGEFFRSVFLVSLWPGLNLRFDLYYRDGDADWATGKVLATQGGRFRPPSGL